MEKGLSTGEYSKRWYRIILNKIFTLAFLKFFLLIGVILLSGAIIFYGKIPLDPKELRLWVTDKGGIAPFLLVLINNIAIFNPFIPNQIIHITAGALYGPVVGFLMIYPSSILGWSLNYFLGRKLGRGFVEEMIGKDTLAKLDDNVRKATLKDFIILIFTPGVSYDVLGYIAGTVKANFKNFFFGAVIGSVVPTIITISVGEVVVENPWIGVLVTVVGIIFSMSYAIYVVKFRKVKSAQK